MLVFGIFDLAKKQLYLVKAVHAVVIDGVAVCRQHSLLIPISQRERSNAEHCRRFLDGKVRRMHVYESRTGVLRVEMR